MATALTDEESHAAIRFADQVPDTVLPSSLAARCGDGFHGRPGANACARHANRTGAGHVRSRPPPLPRRKVADSVEVFRYGGHQSMFVVTPAGVLATDPIAHQRPQAAQT